MGKWRTVTKILIVAIVAVGIVYDVIAYVRGGVGATISRVTLAWAHANPVIPFAFGVLNGHLWWKQYPENDKGDPK